MSESNSKGMFERAQNKWLCAVIYSARHLKCRADRVNSVRNVADLMLMHTSRAMFFKAGDLVAFPSLQRLAFMAGLNEKTVRRAIDDLVGLGLIKIKHRFEDSNFFYLTIPAEAEGHSTACLDLLTNRRNRTASTRHSTRQDPQQLSARMDNYEGQTPVNVQGHSDRHSDLHSISKRHDLASCRLSEDQKEKRVGEEARSSTRPQPTPMAECFRHARKIGAASVIGRAVNHWYRSPEEIRDAIDVVREEGGNASDLAHLLWEPELE
jgi:hypothetical protein